MGAPDAVLIAGPTASGKSALATKLARDYGGAVINTDALQVYRELRVSVGAAGCGGRSAGAALSLRFCQCVRAVFGRALA